MNGFKKIALLGGGAFGVALAKLAASNSQDIVLWARDHYVCDIINSQHRHPHKLSDINLPKNVRATSDLKSAVLDAEIVILALPMSAMKEVLLQAQYFFQPSTIIVSCAKGISFENLAFPCDILASILPENLAQRACYLSGPSFARELASGLPTALTLASLDKTAGAIFQRGFSTEYCRLYLSYDITGVCVGGALKNVIAIAAGACTGLGLGHNALASLITRGLREVTRLALKLGAKTETLSGLSGVGDLILSCTGHLSRNHKLGLLLAKGFDLASALKKIGSVVEGAQSAQAIVALMKKYQVDMPISHGVYRVLYEQVSPKEAISALLARDLKDESF